LMTANKAAVSAGAAATCGMANILPNTKYFYGIRGGRQANQDAGFEASRWVRPRWGDGYVLGGASRFPPAAWTAGPTSGERSQTQRWARRSGLLPGAWLTDTCHRRSTKAP